MSDTWFVETPRLEVACETHGDPAGDPVILLHGFPYDPRCFDRVAPDIADAGAHVVVPYLRGYGATRFRDDDTVRSGQQAALGQDLLDLLDALALPHAVLAGFDWGGRAACIVAATAPERVSGLVTVGGYNGQSIAHASEPQGPEVEQARWYQHFFQHEIGRRALEERRDETLEYLWRAWSPMWIGASDEYDASSHSFENPDFVDVVIHSYRHRFGNVPGDPAYDDLEAHLAEQPDITVPTIIVEPDSDGVDIGARDPAAATRFTGWNETRVLNGIGHNPPQEAPEAFADAVLAVRRHALSPPQG